MPPSCIQFLARAWLRTWPLRVTEACCSPFGDAGDAAWLSPVVLLVPTCLPTIGETTTLRQPFRDSRTMNKMRTLDGRGIHKFV